MADEKDEPEHADMFGGDEGEEEEGEEEGDDEEKKEEFTPETVREYVEKVSDGHGAEKKGKAEAADNTHSPVSSAKGRPSTTATPHNIAQGSKEETGGKPGEGLVGGVKGKFTDNNTHNVDNVKSGVKTLSKVAGGHGAEKKGAGEHSANTTSVVNKAQ